MSAPTTRPGMVELQLEIEPHLARIERLLPSPYRLTLVARHTGMSDEKNADIILTRDDPALVHRAIARLLPTAGSPALNDAPDRSPAEAVAEAALHAIRGYTKGFAVEQLSGMRDIAGEALAKIATLRGEK